MTLTHTISFPRPQQCFACRFINPVSYGVPYEYAFGPGSNEDKGGGSCNASVSSSKSNSSSRGDCLFSSKDGTLFQAKDEAATPGRDEDADPNPNPNPNPPGRDEDGGSDRKSEHSSERKSGAASEDGREDGKEDSKEGRERATSTSTIDYNLKSMASSSRDEGDENVSTVSGELRGSPGLRGMLPQRKPRASSNNDDDAFVDKLSLSARLQALPELPAGTFGRPYGHASRILALLSTSITPREVTHNLLLALKWLLKDAVAVSGRRDYLGADLMFPILVLVLINAQIPTMHLVLHFLRKFGEYDVQVRGRCHRLCSSFSFSS